MTRREISRIALRVANQDSLSELGMSATYGQDEVMSLTHTDLENDDIENFDSRPDVGGESCQHRRVIPGGGSCPDCGTLVS